MQFKNTLIILIILSFSTSGKDNILLKQGDIELSFNDIDGYAQTIPKDKREGFFNSNQRIDKTLIKLLNIKKIVKYANSMNMIDVESVEMEVQKKLINYEFNDSDLSIMKNNSYTQYIEYIRLLQTYRTFQEKFKSQINRDSLIEMAKEIYMIDKSKYMSKESRDFSFVAIKSSKNNNNLDRMALKKIKEMVNTNNDFKSIANKQKQINKNLEISEDFKNFEKNNKYLEFSNFIFSTNSLGVMDDILSIPPKLYLINITKINKKKMLPFEKVKSDIVEGLVMTKYERDFQSLLFKLTTDEVIINKNNVISLKTRYTK